MSGRGASIVLASKTSYRRGWLQGDPTPCPPTPSSIRAKASRWARRSAVAVPISACLPSTVEGLSCRGAQPLLFDRVDDPEPSRVIDLDPRT